MPELLWLLLPVAAASGWYVARCEYRRRTQPVNESGSIPQEYIKGLNYLLNEQPDKAVDTFLRVVELDRDTLELHLALGSLFRKRGEVDRAIRIHQRLLEEKGIPDSLYRYTLLELAKDYMSAGLLDRAENLCLELVDSQPGHIKALTVLYEVYQQEKDWFRAIDIARKLATGQRELNYQTDIAHFYCELADAALLQNELANASRFLDKALNEDHHCGRAYLQQAAIAQRSAQWQQAIDSYQTLASAAPYLLGEVVTEMEQCYRSLNAQAKMLDFLAGIVPENQNTDLLLARTALIQHQQGRVAARDFLSTQLKTIPSLKGIKALAELGGDDTPTEHNQLIAAAVANIIKDKPLYHCEHCGFASRVMHWNCPSCKCWGNVKPIREFRWGASI